MDEEVAELLVQFRVRPSGHRIRRRPAVWSPLALFLTPAAHVCRNQLPKLSSGTWR
jgi:hypothetical protein